MLLSRFLVAAAIFGMAVTTAPIIAREAFQQPVARTALSDAAPIAAFLSGMVLVGVANRRRTLHKVHC
jgi:hypothetical protein